MHQTRVVFLALGENWYMTLRQNVVNLSQADPTMSNITVSGDIFNAKMNNAVDSNNIDLVDGPWYHQCEGDNTFNLNHNSICMYVT